MNELNLRDRRISPRRSTRRLFLASNNSPTTSLRGGGAGLPSPLLGSSTQRLSLLKIGIFIVGFLTTGTMSVYIYFYAKSQMHINQISTEIARESIRKRTDGGGGAGGVVGMDHKNRENVPSVQGNNNKMLLRKSPENDSNNWLDPRTSKPPPSIDASAVAKAPKWQKLRHSCIRYIRHRQDARQSSPSKDETTKTDKTVRDMIHQATRILLVDPAYHDNVGDHMISVGEQVFVQRQKMPSSTYAECSYYQAGPWAPPCTELLKATHEENFETSVALWHGGGNWGDLWPKIHGYRTESMTLLLSKNFTVIGMPQSLYFQNKKAEEANRNDFRKAVALGLGLTGIPNDADLARHLQSRLVLTWREQESLEKAQQLYPYAKHMLMPDIAFQLGPYDAKSFRGSSPRVDLLFFLRADHESLYSNMRDRQTIRSILSQNPKSAKLSYSVVDWSDRLDRFDAKDYYFTQTAVQLLDSGKVVICDRLHAAILAYLSGIPFVYMDQVSGKISKTFDGVAMGSNQICRHPALWESATNLTDAVDKGAMLWKEIIR